MREKGEKGGAGWRDVAGKPRVPVLAPDPGQVSLHSFAAPSTAPPPPWVLTHNPEPMGWDVSRHRMGEAFKEFVHQAFFPCLPYPVRSGPGELPEDQGCVEQSRAIISAGATLSQLTPAPRPPGRPGSPPRPQSS